VIDTSAMVAALISDHQFHTQARPHLRADSAIPAIVLAESYAQLRRTFGLSSSAASTVLRPWTAHDSRIVATDADVVRDVFGRATELNLGGNIHDALVAATCRARNLPLVTLDRRQHAVALAFGVASTLLLPS